MAKRRGRPARGRSKRSNSPVWFTYKPIDVPFPKPLGGRKGPSRSEKNLEVYGDIKVYKIPELEEAENGQ